METKKEQRKKSMLSILQWLLIIFGIVGIINGIVGDTTDRFFCIALGLLCVCAGIFSAFLWSIICLVFLGTTAAGIASLVAKEEAIDTAYILTLITTLGVAIYAGWKTVKKIKRIPGIKITCIVDLSAIDQMSGLEFEHYTAHLLDKLSYTNVTVTKASGDQGIDVLAQKDGIRYAIQCKHYSNRLDNTPVQEAYAGKRFYGCDIGVVITNSTFSDGAKELADSTGILLWDRNVLKEMIYAANKKEKSKHSDITDDCDKPKSAENTTSNKGSNITRVAHSSIKIGSPENHTYSELQYKNVESTQIETKKISKTAESEQIKENTSIDIPKGKTENLNVEKISKIISDRIQIRNEQIKPEIESIASGIIDAYQSFGVSVLSIKHYFDENNMLFYVRPCTGVKIKDVLRLTDDVAMALGLPELTARVQLSESAIILMVPIDYNKQDSSEAIAIDELLPAAVDVILETGQASVSMLQRRLKLGYARAARIVDEMEDLGIVGPFIGSNPREIFITQAQWDLIQEHCNKP